MANQTEIINVALSRIGANEITSLTDGTNEQKIAVNLWAVNRRSALRDHTWNFALKDVELPQIVGTTNFDYQYAYRLPADCIRLVQVYGNFDFKLQSRMVLTDASSCKIKYVSDVVDTELWDDSFTDLMAQRLAADLAYALTKSQSTADSMYAIYERKLKTARHIDSTEDIQDPLNGYESSIISARF